MSATHDDPLWEQVKGAPAFRALLRAVESRFYQGVALRPPVLDLGCGDGHFSQTTFADALDVGVDPSRRSLCQAQDRGVYRLAVQAEGGALPFADGQFGAVISNSVLEHIPDIEAVLGEVGRVLQGPSHDSAVGEGEPPGVLVMTVPSEHFGEFLSIGTFLSRLGFDRAAAAYEGWFNRISRHFHCDSPTVWHQRLAAAGLKTIRWQYYFSRRAHHRLEWGHYLGLPALVSKLLFRRWIIAPWRSSLRWTERLLRSSYEEPPPDQGAYLFFVAERMRPGEPCAPLPPPSPLQVPPTKTLEEIVIQPAAPTIIAGDEQPRDDDRVISDDRHETGRAGPSMTSLVWLGLALIFGILGQVSWNWIRRPYEPADGLTWYGLALLALALFARGSAPRLAGTSERIESALDLGRTWLRQHFFQGLVVLAGLTCSLRARHLVGDVPESPDGGGVALLWWAVGIALVLLALWPGVLGRLWLWSKNLLQLGGPRAGEEAGYRTGRRWRSWNRWEVGGLVFLLAAALLSRLLRLDEIPYVLAGDEASLGREGVRVLSGELGNPFITGWFSHPTLYAFLLAGPLRFFGQTTFGVRFLSPFIGTLSVLATYLFARRAWGRPVALISAGLLAGYHFHIHYSRLALNNIWDPLFSLLVLGALWQGWRERDRRYYLVAGLALGVSQYFYMGARLLLVLVIALVGYWVVRDRGRLWRERSNLVAFALMALAVALPIVLFSLNHPDDYMARMNQLGIFHSGWLSREIEITGRSAGSLLWDQLWKSALAFNYSIDPTFWYRPGVPLLRFWPSILFVFGMGLAVSGLKRTRNFVLILWIAATVLFAGALLENPPSSQRYVIAAPAVCIVIALALAWIAKRLNGLLGGRQTAWMAAAMLVALLFVWGDMRFYFGEYSAHGDYGGLNTEVAQRVADYLTTLDSDYRVFFFGFPRMGISEQGGFPTVPFLAPDAGSIDVVEPLAESDILSELTLPAVFVFLPERAFEMQTVRDVYPYGVEKRFPGRYERLLFVAYEVEG